MGLRGTRHYRRVLGFVGLFGLLCCRIWSAASRLSVCRDEFCYDHRRVACTRPLDVAEVRGWLRSPVFFPVPPPFAPTLGLLLGRSRAMIAIARIYARHVLQTVRLQMECVCTALDSALLCVPLPTRQCVGSQPPPLYQGACFHTERELYFPLR